VIASITHKTPAASQGRERIARLLRLQQVTSFSRHPIAPFPARGRFRRPVDNPMAAWPAFTATGGGAFSKAAACIRPDRDVSVHGRSKFQPRPSAGNGTVRRSLPARVRVGNSIPGRSGWSTRKSAASISTTVQASNPSRSAAGSVLRSSIQMSPATGHTALNSGKSPSVKRSFAPVSVPRDEITTQQTDQLTQNVLAARPTNAGINNVAPHAEPVAPVGFTKVAAEAAMDPSSKQPGQANGKPGSRSGVIHLDSTSLGRWTVEHLAQTLSRQSTGMTGIDPRISAPRSRLSPF
jgi:hypothetical protein